MFINQHVSALLAGCRLFGLAILVCTAVASLAFADHKKGHDRGGRGGENGGGRYDVEVLGTDTLSSNGTIFLGFGGGSRFKTVSTVGTVELDGLSFFSDKFDEDRGDNCFGAAAAADVPVEGLQTVLAIYQAKDGSALVQYVFTGFADNGTTEVGYTLEMFGYFMPDVWRPVGGTTYVVLETWEMFINNTGGVRNIACTGTGSIIPNGISTIVTVTERQS